MARKKLEVAGAVPLGDNVLLEVLERAPEMYKCRVTAVGKGIKTYFGLMRNSVRVGDVVLVNRHPVDSVFIDGQERLLVRNHNVRLKVKK